MGRFFQVGINYHHKDRVFKFIFGNPENKQWTLSLYNAINGSNHENPDDIQFNTIEDAVYLGMKNDASFILAILNELIIWGHQSSFNPNVPLRIFIYAAKLYEAYIVEHGYQHKQYGTKLLTLPRPKCICFYNGRSDRPEREELRLSDAFGGDGDIEVIVTMININYGKNKALMEACEPLKEYAWLVDAIRRHEKISHDIEVAVDAAIDEMPDDFLIKKFLLKNKAEVKGMFLTEYDQEKVVEYLRLEGIERGIEQNQEQVATDMLKDGEPLAKIVRYSRLAEDAILQLANSLGVTAI